MSCCSEGKNEGSVEWVPGLVYLWGIGKQELDSTLAVGCSDCTTPFLAVGWLGVPVLTGRYGRRIRIDSRSCLFRFTVPGRHVPPQFILFFFHLTRSLQVNFGPPFNHPSFHIIYLRIISHASRSVCSTMHTLQKM